MSRPLRIEFPGAVYHVTSRGNARQKIYREDYDREQFLSTLAHVIGRWAHTQAGGPALNELLSGWRHLNRAIHRAYDRYGYRM